MKLMTALYLIVFLYTFSVISKLDQEACLAENHVKQEKYLSYEVASWLYILNMAKRMW